MFFEKFFSDLYIAHKYDEKPVNNKRNHFHMGYEIILFIRGNAEFTIENKKCEPVSGSLLFIAPGQNHRINVKNADSPYERCIIRFSDNHLSQELVYALKNRYGCFSTENTVIAPMFINFDEYIGNYHGRFDYELIKCALQQLLYHFVSNTMPYKLITGNKRIAEIIDYIDNNITNNFTLEDLCGDLKVSDSLICREFQKYMNTGIMAYVRRKRILLAESLLHEGAKPLGIYRACGFVTYSTFFRAYKNVLGHNPTNKTKNMCA